MRRKHNGKIYFPHYEETLLADTLFAMVKSMHEVKIDDLYIRDEYKGQVYFTDLEEAQKRLKELQ